MTFDEVKEKLVILAENYFGEGNVVFAGTKMVRQPEPYVTLQFTGFSRQLFPTNVYDSSDEYHKSYRRIVGHLDLNIYSKGKDMSNGRGLPVYANTTMGRMQGFLGYLDSDRVTELLYRDDIFIIISGEVRDLSALQRDSAYQFRAMAALDVSFTDESFGGFGIDNAPIDQDDVPERDDLATGPYAIESVNIEEEEIIDE